MATMIRQLRVEKKTVISISQGIQRFYRIFCEKSSLKDG
jgi:hypothetical protein